MESFGHPGEPKKLIKVLGNQFKKANGRGTQNNSENVQNRDSPEPYKVGFGSRGVLILTYLPKRLKVIQKAPKSHKNGSPRAPKWHPRPLKRPPGTKGALRAPPRGQKEPLRPL
jgi:hypothetical protein